MDDGTTARSEFGMRLAALRKQARLSQSQLAERLCATSGTTTLTRNEVSRWERGQRLPDAWLASLAAVLAVPLAELERAVDRVRGTAPADDYDDSPHAEVQRLAGRLLHHDQAYGGDCVADAASQLWRAEVARIQGGDTHRLSVASELAEITGWLLFDADRQSEARAAFVESLHLARLAGNRSMEWFALDLLAMHGIENRRIGEVLAICDELTSRPVPPRIALLADIRRSRALALAGDRPRATAAIERARSALDESLHPKDPRWAWWVDDEEISGQEGEVFLALADPSRAIPHLVRTSELVSEINATGRGAFFYRTAELTALTAAHAWQDAEATLLHLPPILATVSSTRTRARLCRTLRAVERGGPAWLADTARDMAAGRERLCPVGRAQA
ncbi:helix-turn-helix domain-containing protein [Streptomyces silvensis]|uniref:HTH cro/C1-type domain-containing protein n=1 Tax=Streptomyces silvensis TaxID=1765722 RepID=A0A0W7X3Q9_9ACTN|nr:helix-turn-helix transcriptional regulator [Streptomyces silvensis]KUF17541.1 hypothetical protein AT728_08930 [Streptomyces silvensis]